MKYLIRFIGILGLTLLILKVISALMPPVDLNAYNIKGKYNEDLSSIQSMESLFLSIEEVAEANAVTPDDHESLAEIIDSLLSYRFYHGTNRYSFTDQYLAYLLGVTIWKDMHVVVLPQDLLKGKVTVCSQQQILFQKCLEEYNIRFRTINLNKHQATEVFYNESWHFFDSDYEPDLAGRPSAEELFNEEGRFGELYSRTEGHLFNEHFEEILQNKTYTTGDENTVLARNMRYTHQILRYFGDFGGIILLLIFILFKKK